MENTRLSKLRDSKHGEPYQFRSSPTVRQRRSTSSKLTLTPSTFAGMLLLSLVDDFLGFYGLSYTRSCLLSESQVDEESLLARP